MKRTPRQELIEDAVSRVRYRGMTPHMALESQIDECKQFGPNTLAAAMIVYYRNISDNGLGRLIKTVENKAK